MAASTTSLGCNRKCNDRMYDWKTNRYDTATKKVEWQVVKRMRDAQHRAREGGDQTRSKENIVIISGTLIQST
jgi:hypothetical protein